LLKSRQMGGGGLAVLLLFSTLFSALVLWFLVLAIWGLNFDEIKNTHKNDSRGKGIVENP
jgi:hypothetical protein